MVRSPIKLIESYWKFALIPERDADNSLPHLPMELVTDDANNSFSYVKHSLLNMHSLFQNILTYLIAAIYQNHFKIQYIS